MTLSSIINIELFMGFVLVCMGLIMLCIFLGTIIGYTLVVTMNRKYKNIDKKQDDKNK